MENILLDIKNLIIYPQILNLLKRMLGKTIAAVPFAILRDYLLYTYRFIVQFIHATYFNFIHIFFYYFLFVKSFNFYGVSPISCENYTVTLIRLLFYLLLLYLLKIRLK